jgi:hypothetical protein
MAIIKGKTEIFDFINFSSYWMDNRKTQDLLTTLKEQQMHPTEAWKLGHDIGAIILPLRSTMV